jgi:hypothetical protein
MNETPIVTLIGKAFWDIGHAAQRSIKPEKVYAGLCCLGNTSGDETDGSMIPAQIGIFALPSTISCPLNSSARIFRPVYEEAGAATTKWIRNYETSLARAKSFDEVDSVALG